MRLLLTLACVAALAWAQEKKNTANTLTSSSTEEVTVIGPAIVVEGEDQNVTNMNSTSNMTSTASNMTSATSNMTVPTYTNMTSKPVMPSTTEMPTEEPSKTTETTMEGNMTMPTVPENTTTHHSGNSSAVVVTSMSAVSLCLLSLLVVS